MARAAVCHGWARTAPAATRPASTGHTHGVSEPSGPVTVTSCGVNRPAAYTTTPTTARMATPRLIACFLSASRPGTASTRTPGHWSSSATVRRRDAHTWATTTNAHPTLAHTRVPGRSGRIGAKELTAAAPSAARNEPSTGQPGSQSRVGQTRRQRRSVQNR